MMMQLSLGELAQRLGAELIGDADTVIRGVNTLKDATATDVSFLANASYRSQLPDSNAGAVIVSAKEAADVRGAALVVANPYLSFALVTQMFDNRPQPVRGIHPSAVVAASATLGDDVCIAVFFSLFFQGQQVFFQTFQLFDIGFIVHFKLLNRYFCRIGQEQCTLHINNADISCFCCCNLNTQCR